MQQASASQETPLPRAVRANVERIRAKVAARAENPNPNPAEPPATPGPETPVLNAAETAPPVEATIPEAVPTEPVDPRHNDPRYWELRYRTEAGMHKSTKRVHAAETEGLRQQIVELQEKLRTAQSNAPQPAVNVEEYFSPEEIEKYGREQCEVMARTSKRIADKQAQVAIDAAVQPLRQETQQARSAAVADEADQFRRELTKLVPDWAAIDESQRWLEWLEEPDPETGVQYGVILHHHVQGRNPHAAAKVFQKYKQFSRTPVPPVAPNGSAAAPTLETPPTPGATAGNPQGLLPLRPGEAKEYYRRAAIGRVSEEERRVFEQRLKLPRS